MAHKGDQPGFESGLRDVGSSAQDLPYPENLCYASRVFRFSGFETAFQGSPCLVLSFQGIATTWLTNIVESSLSTCACRSDKGSSCTGGLLDLPVLQGHFCVSVVSGVSVHSDCLFFHLFQPAPSTGIFFFFSFCGFFSVQDTWHQISQDPLIPSLSECKLLAHQLQMQVRIEMV